MDGFLELIRVDGALDVVLMLIDMALIYFLLYRGLLLIKGTRALQMLVGLVLVIGFFFLSKDSILDLKTTHWFIEKFIANIIIVIVIIFQHDIRRALAQVGRAPIFSNVRAIQKAQVLEEIIKVSVMLSHRKLGALMAIEREADLSHYIEEGIKLDSVVTKDLLFSLFVPEHQNPLHDGAVVIQKGRVSAAGCFLPLTNNPRVEKSLGTRHRAAIGLTEDTDAAVVVVSEESGIVSVAYQGELHRELDANEMRELLQKIFSARQAQPRSAKLWTRLRQMRERAHDQRKVRGALLWSALGGGFRTVFVRNIYLKLIALILMLALYIWVQEDRETVLTTTASVRMNYPDEFVLVSPPVEEVKLTLKGRWSDLKRLDTDRLEPVRIEANKEGSEVVPVDVAPLQLPPGLRVQSVDPSYVRVSLEEKMTKEVPVRVRLIGEPPPSYHVKSVQAKPKTIQVIGPQSVIERLQSVFTEPVDVSQRTDSSTEELRLRLDNPLIEPIGADAVQVTIAIESESVERKVQDVPIRPVNTTYQVAIMPETIDLTLRGPKTLVDDLDPADLLVSIDLSQEDERPPGVFQKQPMIRNLPLGVEAIRIHPTDFRVVTRERPERLQP